MVKRLAAGVAMAMTAAAVVSAQGQRLSLVEQEQVRARQKVSMMEAVLERAVSNGADNMLRQVRDVMPDLPMLTDTPHVRGFRLDGFGVFFDVDVPALRIPLSWTLRYMVDDNGIAAGTALTTLRVALEQHVNDPRERASLEQAIRRLELQVGPAQPRSVAGRAAGTQTVSAQNVQASGPPPISAADPGVIEDPNEAYTREVKAALIEAMLENSGGISVGPEEWLAVAARDNIRPDRLVPTDATDTHTIMFRVKGSDLAAFHEKRISVEEARKKVEVREY